MHTRTTLLLNADFKPMGYHPLSVLGWQDAIKDVFLGRVSVVEEYDAVVRSPGSATQAPTLLRLPSVVALKAYQRLDRPAAFTRIGLMLRDRFTCAYCGERFPAASLTFDHVVPRARGGGTSYGNIVAACGPCNARKGCKTVKEVGMTLRHRPYIPTRLQLNEIARALPQPTVRVPPSWLPYLGLPPAAMERARVGDMSSSGAVFPDDMSAADYWSVELDIE